DVAIDAAGRGVDPGFHGHGGGLEGRRARDLHVTVNTVETERLAYVAGGVRHAADGGARPTAGGVVRAAVPFVPRRQAGRVRPVGIVERVPAAAAVDRQR